MSPRLLLITRPEGEISTPVTPPGFGFPARKQQAAAGRGLLGEQTRSREGSVLLVSPEVRPEAAAVSRSNNPSLASLPGGVLTPVVDLSDRSVPDTMSMSSPMLSEMTSPGHAFAPARQEPPTVHRDPMSPLGVSDVSTLSPERDDLPRASAVLNSSATLPMAESFEGISEPERYLGARKVGSNSPSASSKGMSKIGGSVVSAGSGRPPTGAARRGSALSATAGAPEFGTVCLSVCGGSFDEMPQHLAPPTEGSLLGGALLPAALSGTGSNGSQWASPLRIGGAGLKVEGPPPAAGSPLKPRRRTSSRDGGTALSRGLSTVVAPKAPGMGLSPPPSVVRAVDRKPGGAAVPALTRAGVLTQSTQEVPRHAPAGGDSDAASVGSAESQPAGEKGGDPLLSMKGSPYGQIYNIAQEKNCGEQKLRNRLHFAGVDGTKDGLVVIRHVSDARVSAAQREAQQEDHPALHFATMSFDAPEGLSNALPSLAMSFGHSPSAMAGSAVWPSNYSLTNSISAASMPYMTLHQVHGKGPVPTGAAAAAKAYTGRKVHPHHDRTFMNAVGVGAPAWETDDSTSETSMPGLHLLSSPLWKEDGAAAAADDDDDGVQDENLESRFVFDAYFDDATTQEELYRCFGQKLLATFMHPFERDVLSGSAVWQRHGSPTSSTHSSAVGIAMASITGTGVDGISCRNMTRFVRKLLHHMFKMTATSEEEVSVYVSLLHGTLEKPTAVYDAIHKATVSGWTSDQNTWFDLAPLVRAHAADVAAAKRLLRLDQFEFTGVCSPTTIVIEGLPANPFTLTTGSPPAAKPLPASVLVVNMFYGHQWDFWLTGVHDLVHTHFQQDEPAPPKDTTFPVANPLLSIAGDIYKEPSSLNYVLHNFSTRVDTLEVTKLALHALSSAAMKKR
eukprot:TRINITY_DN378_c0_g2_i1.p1 TRINITY_DN378_c0_g2~~TRINITY_DN378_c0_g2_i1.p1  ORF type:complete len:902 (+),score=256.62 TRINITY_DN378_c0_g2_i1:2159-4864(+)